MTFKTPPKQPSSTPKKAQKTSKTSRNSAISAKIPSKPKKTRSLSAKEISAKRSVRYQATKTVVLAQRKANYDALSEADKCIRRWRLEAKPSYPKPGSQSAKVPRKMAKAQAYCNFSDTDEVVRIYIACAVINELDWGKYVVDHLVPLQARTCSGLHTHTNLRVISEAENKAKGWHLWPDMWPMSWDSLPLLMALRAAQGD